MWYDFVQPKLSANGVIGGSTFAAAADSYYDSPRQPYAAFDGLNGAESNCWHAKNTSNNWLEWYYPYPLMVTGLKVQNRTSTGGFLNNYIIQYSKDNSNWVDVVSGTNTNTTDSGIWSIDMSSNTTAANYWRIYILSHYQSYAVIGEMTITGKYCASPIISEHLWASPSESQFIIRAY